MGFWKRLVGAFSGLSGRGRRMLDGVWGSRGGDAPVRGTKEFLEVYEASPWVRAVAGRVSTSVGATEWTLSRNDGRPIVDHLLLRALRTPNPQMSGNQLVKVTQLCLDLVGDAFWLKGRNGLNAPVEFWPIPPHWVTELPTPARPRFQVQQYSWQEEIPDTEIVWFHDAAPADPYRRGSGVVRAQADEIETHEYASKHAKQLFWNRAIPEFVVMDEQASPEEIDRHEKAFNQRLQGFWRWFKPYFVNRKLEFWQPQQMNLENLTMVPLLKHERDVIIQAWGMPPEQLGIVENSNRATIEGSDYVYENRIVRPRRLFLRDALQALLVPEYDDRLRLGFVDTVPEDKQHLLDVAKAAPHALTLDEWRHRAGLPLVGGELGSSRMVPLNSYLTIDPLDPETRPQAAGPGRPPSSPAPDDDEAEPKSSPVVLVTQAGEAISLDLQKQAEAIGEIAKTQSALAEQVRTLALRPVAAPVVNVPAPVVNVPAPVVNVPAPVVNVEAPQPPKTTRTRTIVTKRGKSGAIEETITEPVDEKG